MSGKLTQTIIIRTAIVLAVAYVLLNLGLAIRNNYHINNSIRTLKREITELEARIVFLRNKIVYLSSDSYREIETRRRLSLKREGETVVLVPSNADERAQQDVQPRQTTLTVDQTEEEVPSWPERASEHAATWIRWLGGNEPSES